MTVETVNSLLVKNKLQQANTLQQTNKLLQPPSTQSPALVSSGVYQTSLTLNTTGATLLVAVLVSDTAAGATMSDSLSNTWNYIAGSTSTGAGITRIAYAYASSANPLATGASDVFTITEGGGSQYTVAAIYAFSGTKTTSAVYGGNNVTAAPQSPTNPYQGGALTPTAGNLVVFGTGGDSAAITAASASVSPATDALSAVSHNNSSSKDSVAATDVLVATGSALNITWTLTGPSTAQLFTCIAAEFVAGP